MKHLSLTILVLVIGFFNVLAITAQQVPTKTKETSKDDFIKLTDEDKAELIKLALEMALVKKEIPDYNQIQKQEHFLLSTENIKPELVPEIKGIKLILLEPEEIQERADKKGDLIFYFRFKKLKAEGSKILVYLDNIPMYAKNFTQRFLLGGGFTIEFQKKDGKWVCVIPTSWIS